MEPGLSSPPKGAATARPADEHYNARTNTRNLVIANTLPEWQIWKTVYHHNVTTIWYHGKSLPGISQQYNNSQFTDYTNEISSENLT